MDGINSQHVPNLSSCSHHTFSLPNLRHAHNVHKKFDRAKDGYVPVAENSVASSTTSDQASTSSIKWATEKFCNVALKNWLLCFNVIAASCHLCLFILCIVIGSVVGDKDFFTPYLNVHEAEIGIDTNMSTFSVENVVVTNRRLGSGISIPLMTTLFFGITSLFHLAISFDIGLFQLNSFYLKQLYESHNYARWVEYSITASIMIVLIANPVGIQDIRSLLLVVALCVTTMLFGAICDLISAANINDRKSYTNWDQMTAVYLMGWVPYMSMWAIIFSQFAANADNETVLTSSNGTITDRLKMPDVVYLIVIGQFVLFTSFGFVQGVQIYLGPSRYYYGEVAYVILSLTSKAFLGIVYFTIIARDGFYDSDI